MLHILLVRPGSTSLDEDGRIKGSLDIPLSSSGAEQVTKTAQEVANLRIEQIYSSPCQSAQQTAASLAAPRSLRVKVIEGLRNIDHGLWQGKLIDEVRRQLPRIYKQFQESPESFCPPGGETLEAAANRAAKDLIRIFKRHKSGTIALVIPDPMASLVKRQLVDCELGDMWKSECDFGTWEIIPVGSRPLALA